MELLKRIFHDIKKGENISFTATIVLAFSAAIVNALGYATGALVTSLTLTTLGLLAVGFLAMRYRFEDFIVRQPSDIANMVHLHDKSPLLLDTYLEQAQEIHMMGLMLRDTTYKYYMEFRERSKHGLIIKALMANPTGSNINMEHLTYRFSRGETSDLFRAAYDSIMRQYAQLRRSASKPDNVQLRLLDFVPPFSLYIFPNKKDGGIAFVELYAYRSPPHSTPRFILTERENPLWYKNFVRHFELMWKDSVDYFEELDISKLPYEDDDDDD